MVGGGILRLALSVAVMGAGSAFAQAPPADQAGARDSLTLHFGLGSAALRPEDEALLDQASRLYRDAKPVIMVLTGSTDTVGPAERNLLLAQARTAAVLRGLAERGVPAERFLLVAKGEAELAVRTPDGTDEWRNRRVDITWR